jgi:hypothetical protein
MHLILSAQATAKSRKEDTLSNGISLSLTQTVTTVWRTELGTTLLIGLFRTTAVSAYFRYLGTLQFASILRRRQVPRQYGPAHAGTLLLRNRQ